MITHCFRRFHTLTMPSSGLREHSNVSHSDPRAEWVIAGPVQVSYLAQTSTRLFNRAHGG